MFTDKKVNEITNDLSRLSTITRECQSCKIQMLLKAASPPKRLVRDRAHESKNNLMIISETLQLYFFECPSCRSRRYITKEILQRYYKSLDKI